ncbi:hypothetical protein [Massilia sp. Dwa41.01b]|uniref:hypothetical protein n=1 Tax=Massilia sp. Dwa41.01b TaxID=2709302 RepID=UPI001E3F9009|nr:hypothetical protein [Massilia sp. Dwa41.01b]
MRAVARAHHALHRGRAQPGQLDPAEAPPASPDQARAPALPTQSRPSATLRLWMTSSGRLSARPGTWRSCSVRSLAGSTSTRPPPVVASQSLPSARTATSRAFS